MDRTRDRAARGESPHSSHVGIRGSARPALAAARGRWRERSPLGERAARGRLVVHEPPGTRHGAIASRLAHYLTDFVYRNRLGVVFAHDTGAGEDVLPGFSCAVEDLLVEHV